MQPHLLLIMWFHLVLLNYIRKHIDQGLISRTMFPAMFMVRVMLMMPSFIFGARFLFLLLGAVISSPVMFSMPLFMLPAPPLLTIWNTTAVTVRQTPNSPPLPALLRVPIAVVRIGRSCIVVIRWIRKFFPRPLLPPAGHLPPRLPLFQLRIIIIFATFQIGIPLPGPMWWLPGQYFIGWNPTNPGILCLLVLALTGPFPKPLCNNPLNFRIHVAVRNIRLGFVFIFIGTVAGRRSNGVLQLFHPIFNAKFNITIIVIIIDLFFHKHLQSIIFFNA